jgi:ABC-type multidrug transport system ATPase subunit
MSTLCELAGYTTEPKLFQKPSKTSRIILFSIHQPTSDIFQLFTNIILMSAGKIIFHGDKIDF